VIYFIPMLATNITPKVQGPLVFPCYILFWLSSAL